MESDPTLERPARNCEKGIRWSGWLGWTLWLITLGGLYFVRHEGVKRDQEIQLSQQSMFGFIERVNRLMASVDTDKVVAALAIQDEKFRAIQTKVKEDIAALTEELVQQREVNKRLATAFAPEDGASQEALKLADEADGAGNKELAIVYLANAIGKRPEDVKLLEKYTVSVVEGKNPTVMQGAEILLQGALYRVAATDVPAVVKLLDQVAKAQDNRTEDVEVTEPKSKSPAETFAELEKSPLRWVSGDHEIVNARIEELSSILEGIVESDPEGTQLREQVNQRITEVQAFAMGHQVFDLTSLRFENLATLGKMVSDQGTENNRTAALSALQATEAAVNQIWSVPMSLVPPELRNDLIALPEKLRKNAEMIQESVEKEDVQIAREVWDKRPNQISYKIQDRIVGCQTAAAECAKHIGKLQGPKSRKEAADLNQSIYSEMNSLKTRQFAEYQKWATKVIEDTRQIYDNKTISNDGDALRAFEHSGKVFVTIDQSLLSPEVAQFMQAVFSKLLGELNGPDQSKLQKEMSFPDGVTKKRMEDF